jgi:hypothetical protein
MKTEVARRLESQSCVVMLIRCLLQLFCVSRAGSFQVIVLYVFSAQLGDNCARKGEADVVVDLVTSVLPRSFSKYWDYLGWLAALIITSAFPGKNSLRYDIFGALGGGLFTL